MTFVLTMARREISASWKRQVFFFVCLAIGVAAIVSVRSVIQSVRGALTREARFFLAADMRVQSESPLTPYVRETLDRERRTGRIAAQSEAIELETMLRPVGQPGLKIVELYAVQEQFPLQGALTLQGGVPYSHELLRNRGTLVRPELLTQLDLQVGDLVLIGRQTFEIRGVVASEPGRRMGMFTLGPRIFIDHADIESTGLLSFGSRADYEMLLRVPDAALDSLNRDLNAAFGSEFVGVRTYKRSQDRMGDNLTRAEDYLSLVGLVVLILGGIGVSSVTRVFVQEKVRSIAILKCLGTTSRQILWVYLTQVLLLGLAGSLLGVAMAAGVLGALPILAGNLAQLVQAEYSLTTGAVMQGLGVGLLVSLLFSLVPLLDVRHVKPSLLLRQDALPARPFDWLKWTVTVVVAALLVVVASWQGGSIEAGLLLCGGLIGVAFVLHLAGLALVRAVQPLRHARSFALRQAVLHVARPGNQTRVIMLAVGLGAFFILGVRSLQVNLLRDFAVQVGEDAPDMFLMDIQRDQAAGVSAMLARESGQEPPKLIPVLRARVTGVRGREVNLASYEEVRERGGLSREFTVTYRLHPEANEEVVAGEWWDSSPMPEGQAEVSVEESLQRRFDIQIGDEMRFEVLGRIVTARVTSVREVDFRDFRAGGFMLVFRPGTFESAPHAYVASVRAPRDPATRAAMQRAVVNGYPNVSVIDLREVLDAIQSVVGSVTIAVSAVGGLVLFSGALILIGAVSMTKFRRVYEAAILRTLGASSRLIATMLVLEYGVLGAIAGTVGALGAIALSWGVARFALELNWEATPLITVTGIAVTALFVAVVGVLASLDVLRHKPLSTLRAE